MSEEMKKTAVETEFTDKDEQAKTEPKEEAKKPEDEKKEQPKKEFFLIRGAKAVGRGVVKAGKAVNGFIHKHPIASSAISAGLGFAAKYGVDYIMGSRSSDDGCAAPESEVHDEPAYLPEPEPEFDYSEPEDVEVEAPAEEVVSEE